MKSDQKDHGHKHDTPAMSYIRSVEAGHEIDRVHIRGIVNFLIFLTILTIVSCLLMWALFRVLNGQEQGKEAQSPPSPVAMSRAERLPPEPRLQSAPGFAEELQKETMAKGSETSVGANGSEPPKDPLWEINVLREHWDGVLKDGVKNDSSRVLIMPIEEAKKELLKQGLPALTDAKPDSAIEMPTAASAGRTTEKRRQ